MNYLLDTNVVSEWVKPRPNGNVIAWLAEANEEEIFISVCTIAELRFGIASMARGKRRDQLDGWLRGDLPARFDGRIIGIDIPIADTWGQIQARARQKGRTLGPMDGLIAATAAVHGMTVVTRNTPHFEAVGVPLLDPWTGR
ncbi:MAG: type II toxin-antitoxin system VapC family toxin [Alphaproteobacteria bacterium]|nr:MAG: type II toxin-antitoxin system VapC family toxin [Alphaproteobacteria bacterium]